MDLTSCSPKAGKTKKACYEAIVYMKDHPNLVTAMEVSGQIPSKNTRFLDTEKPDSFFILSSIFESSVR